MYKMGNSNTHNRLVAGSNPAESTKPHFGLAREYMILPFKRTYKKLASEGSFLV